MPSTIARRLRGAFGLAVTWGIGWAAAGVVAGALIGVALLIPNGRPVHLWQLAGGMGLVGAITGALSAVGFAALLATSARRRELRDLSVVGGGALGALAAGAIALLISRDTTFTVASTALGLVAGAGSLLLARRAAAGDDGATPPEGASTQSLERERAAAARRLHGSAERPQPAAAIFSHAAEHPSARR